MTDLEEFRKIGLTVYEMKIINTLRQKNDLTAKEIKKLSGVPDGKFYQVVSMLIKKRIVEKRFNHDYRKLSVKQQKDLVKAIEKSLEFGFRIRIVGYRKGEITFHLNGSLKSYIDRYISSRVGDMYKLKNVLCGG